MRFLVLFRGTLPSFRLGEFRSLVELVRKDGSGAETKLVPCRRIENPVQEEQHGEVFQWVELRSESEAEQIAARSVLIRAIFRIWGYGDSFDQCLHVALTSSLDLEPLLSDPSKTFKCVVEAFGRSYSVEEQLQKMHVFSPILSTLKAKVKLKNPEAEVWILEDVFPKKGHCHIPDKTEQPAQVFFGLKVASGAQHYASSFTLKKRSYIGTTSMDAEMAFLMANQALIEKGSLIMDPFVGTGSILISCAAFGAFVIGSDIDMNVLRGKEPSGPNIRSNFDQYKLPQPLGIVRSDLLRSTWRESTSPASGWLDAIMCDPPYGIREGSRSFKEYEVSEEHRSGHIPATRRVRFADHLINLLDFSARNLVAGGRLVFWLPTTQDYSDSEVPDHASFKLVSNSEQILTLRFRRRLITFVKVKELSSTALKDEVHRLRYGAQIGDADHTNFAAKVLRQQHRREDLLELIARK